jgi:hypothetical protein
MAEVLVICRFLARKRKENQLRALLQGMLTPTRAESGCELYEPYEAGSRGASICAKHGKVKLRLIDTQKHLPLSTWTKLSGIRTRTLRVNILRRVLTGAAAA